MTLAKLQPAALNTATLVALLLVAAGIIAFAYQGIRYSTRDNVDDLGSMHISAGPSPAPIVGAIALMGGIGLFFAGARKN